MEVHYLFDTTATHHNITIFVYEYGLATTLRSVLMGLTNRKETCQHFFLIWSPVEIYMTYHLGGGGMTKDCHRSAIGICTKSII